jgi:hypothetical protein
LDRNFTDAAKLAVGIPQMEIDFENLEFIPTSRKDVICFRHYK